MHAALVLASVLCLLETDDDMTGEVQSLASHLENHFAHAEPLTRPRTFCDVAVLCLQAIQPEVSRSECVSSDKLLVQQKNTKVHAVWLGCAAKCAAKRNETHKASASFQQLLTMAPEWDM